MTKHTGSFDYKKWIIENKYGKINEQVQDFGPNEWDPNLSGCGNYDLLPPNIQTTACGAFNNLDNPSDDPNLTQWVQSGSCCTPNTSSIEGICPEGTVNNTGPSGSSITYLYAPGNEQEWLSSLEPYFGMNDNFMQYWENFYVAYCCGSGSVDGDIPVVANTGSIATGSIATGSIATGSMATGSQGMALQLQKGRKERKPKRLREQEDMDWDNPQYEDNGQTNIWYGWTCPEEMNLVFNASATELIGNQTTTVVDYCINSTSINDLGTFMYNCCGPQQEQQGNIPLGYTCPEGMSFSASATELIGNQTTTVLDYCVNATSPSYGQFVNFCCSEGISAPSPDGMALPDKGKLPSNKSRKMKKLRETYYKVIKKINKLK